MNEQEQMTDELSRRSILKGAGALGLGALATMASGSVAGISEAFAADVEHHHHGGSTNRAMTDSVHACIKTGHECLAHCIEVIKSGDTSIIDCMKSVQETVAFCEGLAYISASNSKYLNAMCELAIRICSDCQKECEKHAKHAQCKACGEACAACVKECRKHLKT
jgi:Cys-rich four helix bundle protein (predicted Tat secretion target)